MPLRDDDESAQVPPADDRDAVLAAAGYSPATISASGPAPDASIPLSLLGALPVGSTSASSSSFPAPSLSTFSFSPNPRHVCDFYVPAVPSPSAATDGELCSRASTAVILVIVKHITTDAGHDSPWAAAASPTSPSRERETKSQK